MARSAEVGGLEFGIFDHLDRAHEEFSGYYEARLKLAEIYDRAGFYCYHVAEHHATPLGMAPSPSVFLAAVAQRTRTLRIGSLVYLLPLYHPLRLIEEVCMLDHLSGGRMQMGVGRGISPIESGYFGVESDLRQEMYEEALEVLLKGMTSKSLSHEGRFYRYRDVPMEIGPLQRPHPPLWLGVQSAGGARFAARRRGNIVSLLPPKAMREVIDAYENATDAGRSSDAKKGLSFFLVVAQSDAEAREQATGAYARWYQSFNHLYRKHGRGPVLGQQPASFEEIERCGRGVAGTPDRVIAFLQEQVRESGINYVVGQFAFGDLSPEAARRSVELFARQVMGPVRESLAASRIPER